MSFVTASRRSPAPWAARLVAGFAALCSLAATTGFAQEQSAGDASLRVEYQYIRTGNFHDANIEFDYWTTESHVAILAGDYALTDRWSVFAALPYVRKRFNGAGLFNGDPHNPNDPWWVDFQPPDLRFLDDGSYHGDFQDLALGVTYLALDGPLKIWPYIGFGVPVTDYPFYAKAAIGENLWNLPVGASFQYIPYFSDWYLDGSVAYVFSEEPLDVNVDFWLFNLHAGYWFTPRFSANLFVTSKYLRDGLVMPWDFTDDPFYRNYPVDFDTPEWWQHDRLLRQRYVNAGAGFNFALNADYLLTGSYYRTVWVEQSTEVDHAFTLALTRFFSGD